MAPPSLPESLTAGVYTGLSIFLDAAAFATVVFAPAALPFDVGIQHALVGFAIMQTVVATWSAAPIVVPVSYEVMPFLAKFAAGARRAAAASGAAVCAEARNAESSPLPSQTW